MEFKAPKDGNNCMLKVRNIGEPEVSEQNQGKEESLLQLSTSKKLAESPASPA